MFVLIRPILADFGCSSEPRAHLFHTHWSGLVCADVGIQVIAACLFLERDTAVLKYALRGRSNEIDCCSYVRCELVACPKSCRLSLQPLTQLVATLLSR